MDGLLGWHVAFVGTTMLLAVIALVLLTVWGRILLRRDRDESEK